MKQACAAIAMGSLLSGCAAGLPGLRPTSYASPGEARIFVSTEPCVHDETGKEAVGLVATLATAAASALLDSFGTALTKGAEGGALPQAAAVRNLTLEPGRVPSCITFVRGAFNPTRADRSAVDLSSLLWKADDVPSAEYQRRLTALRIPKLYRLDHYVELRLLEAPNRRALTFFPTYVLINRSLDGARSGDRDLTVNLKFSRPGGQDAGGPVALFGQQIGQARPYMIDAVTKRATYEAPWFTFPIPLAAPAATAGNAGAANDSPKPGNTGGTQSAPQSPTPITAGTGLGTSNGAGSGAAGSQTVDPFSSTNTAIPITVTVTAVETRPTRAGLAFIASVFNGAKPELNKALAPLINSNTADTQEAAELGLQAEYASALGAARTALLSYCLAPNKEVSTAGRSARITASASARTAQLKANAAALKLGSAPPYPTLVTVSDALPEDSAGACAGV